MRKNKDFLPLIIILFLLMLSISATANDIPEPDKKDYRLIKLHYENASGEKGLTTFEFDKSGIMSKAHWSLLDGSRNSENYHTFDQNGQLILKYREFSDGLTSRLEYKYEKNGHLIEEDFFRSDSVKGTTRYEYDKNGFLAKADCQGLNGWFYGIIHYVCDEKGRKINATIEKEGKNIGYITYSYNDYGYLEKEYWDFSGTWSQTFVYEYEKVDNTLNTCFTSSNVFMTNTHTYRIVKENYDYSNKVGGPSFYEYEKSGKLKKKIFKRSEGLETVTTYEYDQNGILKKSHRTYSNGLTATFNYEFNGNRRLVGRSFVRSDGLTGSEQYEYDEKMNLTKACYNNMDSWLTGTITFEYDKKGKLSKGFYKDKNEMDAKLTFQYDINGNIVKIHWDFSKDMTQTYTFEYDKITF